MISKQKTIRALQILLTVIGFLLVGYYVYLNKSYFEILLRISRINFLSILVLMIISSYFNAAQNAALIRSLGVPLTDMESFGLSNISAAINTVLPQGQTIVKAIYLKQRYAFSYSKFSVLFLGLLVIFLIIGALLMVLMNSVAIIQGIKVPEILWICSFLGVTSSLLFFFDFPKGFLRKLGKIGVLMENFSDSWKELRSNRLSLIKACLWQIAIFINSGIGITVAYRSIGVNINPLLGISLSVFLSFSNLITIIPGNFGVQEVFYGYISHLSGLMFVQGVVMSTLMRAVGLIIITFISPFSWYLLFFRQRIKLR